VTPCLLGCQNFHLARGRNIVRFLHNRCGLFAELIPRLLQHCPTAAQVGVLGLAAMGFAWFLHSPSQRENDGIIFLRIQLRSLKREMWRVTVYSDEYLMGGGGGGITS
jgi:hypothetical protein